MAWSEDRSRFTGPYARHVVPAAGHNLPQKAPGAGVDAALDVLRTTAAP